MTSNEKVILKWGFWIGAIVGILSWKFSGWLVENMWRV